MHSSAFLETSVGLRIPRIVYGTAWKAQRTADCVRQALEAGFRGIDTACQPKHYDEAAVGRGVAAFLAGADGCARADLYLQTKFTSLTGQDPKRVPYDAHAALPEQVAQSVQVSLRNLGTNYLDCLVLHSPLPSMRDTLLAWRSMEQAVDQGLVRHLGISNCYELKQFEQLCAKARIAPAVLQNRFYAKTGYDKALRATCRARQIVYQSFWTLTANPHLLEHTVITNLCANRKRTPAQVFFRYLTQEGIVPLTGTQSVEHMREDLAIFELDLNDQERAQISAIL